MVSRDLTLQNKTRSVELFDIKGGDSGWNPRDGGVVNVDYDPVPHTKRDQTSYRCRSREGQNEACTEVAVGRGG